MFTIFFTIIFIAELIIAWWLISLILKIDRAVCSLNAKVCASIIPMKKALLNINLVVNKALIAVTKLREKIEEKKKSYALSILRTIMIGILFLTLNKDGKQALSTADTIISVIKLTSKIIKRYA